MKVNFSVDEAVKKRYSVRNYSDKDISEELKKDIDAFVLQLDNPLGVKVHFHDLDLLTNSNDQKLGTYGVIKGARHYIGATVEKVPMALEALGYAFETLILYLAHKDIGTCWLGGTFDRKGFAAAMNLGEKILFPIVSPYGYAANKKHIKEIAMRKVIKADQRKPWNELFFDTDFLTPLTKEKAGEFMGALEMVRLAPSASNKQPWRIVWRDGIWHFYEYKTPGYSDRFTYDIQRIDMGIAAAHFDLLLRQKGKIGAFELMEGLENGLPQNMEYVFSWKPMI